MRFTVNQFIIIPTSTYNPPAMRHYSVDARNSDNIQSLTAEITQGGMNVTPTSMTQLASSILVPSSSRGEVIIPNGFNERRFRFMMELTHEGGAIQYLAGYTDRLEEMNGYLPPDLQLHFNMSFTIRRSRVRDGNNVTTQDSITDVSQILTAPDMDYATALGGMGGNLDSAVTLRPSDVFTVSEAHLAADALREQSQSQGDSGFKVGRITSAVSEFRTGIRKSQISNVSSARYLSSIIGAYASSLGDGGEDNAFHSSYDNANQQLAEPTTASDPFFNQFSMIGKRLNDGGQVSWGEIEAVAPNLTQFAMDSINMSRHATVNSGRNGENFTANTNESIAVVKILNGLSAIMASNLITKLTVYAQSGIPIGMGGPMGGNNTAVTQNAFADIQHFYSFNKNPHPHVGRTMAQAILFEVLADVSRQFTMDVSLQVTYDLIGDTTVSISLNGEPAVDFTNPNWCSARSSLILSPTQDALQNLSHDFKSMFKAVTPRGY